MTTCARSHTVQGQHAPGCTCTRECPDHDGHCPGCLPAPADRGLLCSSDSRRLRGFLGAEEGLDPEHPVHGLPWAWDALGDAYPSLSQAPGGGGSGVDDPEAERASSVISVRADIAERLLYWTFAVMNSTGLAGPDVPAPQRLSVRRSAAFLLVQAEALETHPEVSNAWDELADVMSRAHALAPWRPPPSHLKGIPCRCGELSLHHHGDVIKCWSGACGRVYSAEEYAVLTKVLAHRFARETQDA